MGLRRSGNRAPWSPEEDEVLAKLIGRYPPSIMAHKMGRGLNSVTLRARRLHISRRDHVGWFSKLDIMHILGVDHHWVQHFIDSGQLKASWHFPGHKPGMTGASMWHIESADLRDFIKHHALDLQGRPVDVVGLIEVLAWEEET